MEGVGARLGRSSSRYGTTTVFTGPVRRWKKKWVNVPPPNSNHNHHTAANGTVNGNNIASHLLLYKWTPTPPTETKESNDDDENGSNNGNADPKNSNDDDGVAAEEPPRKRFKFIPIVVLEEQKIESSEQMEDETKPIEPNTNSDEYDDKPDMNDIPLDENQAKQKNRLQRQDLNEALDLSLGLKSRDGENESDSKADETKER